MPTRSYPFEHFLKTLKGNRLSLDNPHVSILREKRMPPIIDHMSLAVITGVSNRVVWKIIHSKEKHYRQFSIKQKNGKIREISSPRIYLKVLQWWILRNVLEHVALEDYVQGFRKNKSILTNAKIHERSKHILNVDIKDFFPSINLEQCKTMFSSLGFPDTVANQFAEICTYEGKLPQGAPTSPAIANIVFRHLDLELHSIAINNNYSYSRYADDITFSSKDNAIPVEFYNTIESFINASTFKLNNKKTRFMGPGSRMEITGLVINEKIQMPITWRKKVRATYYQATLDKEILLEKENQIRGYQSLLKSLEQNNTKLYQTGENLIRLIDEHYTISSSHTDFNSIANKLERFTSFLKKHFG